VQRIDFVVKSILHHSFFCFFMNKSSYQLVKSIAMKLKILLPSIAAVLALVSCGTEPGPNTQRGAATGGLIGAGAGAIIGHQSGRALEGAAIGGVTGAAAGGLYGNARDQEQYGRYR